VPELLAQIIRHPTQFARLRVHFLISLSGKYAVTLYEILEAYTNRQNPVLDVEISQLRRWLKVPDGKLKRWIDIKRFTLEPALKQINDNSIAAGFSVKMEEVKNGRAVARVRFIITKSAERLKSEDTFQSKETTRPSLKLLSPSHIPLPTSAYV
jgi:plasmid replication initiation protein